MVDLLDRLVNGRGGSPGDNYGSRVAQFFTDVLSEGALQSQNIVRC